MQDFLQKRYPKNVLDGTETITCFINFQSWFLKEKALVWSIYELNQPHFFNRTVFFFERTENWQIYIDPMWLHDIHFLKMNSVSFSFQGKQHRICRENKIESFKQNLVFGRVSVCSHDLTFFQKVHLFMRSVMVLQMFYVHI